MLLLRFSLLLARGGVSIHFVEYLRFISPFDLVSLLFDSMIIVPPESTRILERYTFSTGPVPFYRLVVSTSSLHLERLISIRENASRFNNSSSNSHLTHRP